MNRLWIRLTIAFIGMTQLSIIIVGIMAAAGISREFRTYIFHRNTSVLTTASVNQMIVAGTPDPQQNPFGYVVTEPLPADMVLPAPDQEFLDRLYRILVFAAFVVGTVGIVLGVLISRTMVAPLATVANGARAFAARDWNHRIIPDGASEIAAVAHAFNEMADEIGKAESLRRNLIADIAHELRTPLTVLQGNLRALLDGLYPMERAEIASLYDETRYLNRIVDDLRELALADAGQLPLHIESVDVAETFQTAVDNFSVAAEDQGTQINIALDEISSVKADPDRLAQVLRNLIVNALRHTPGGCIRLAAQRQANTVHISVSDTGEGIPPGELQHVFDRFYRGDKSRSRSSGGTGLGLAITKSWVEAMGGCIGAESTLDQGSHFWFTLPIAD